MTLTLLDLYNATATQEWSMYDSDAENKNEFENSLVLAINKAISEILYSYPFNFRERTHIIITVPNINSYKLPSGIIMQDEQSNYRIQINSKPLKLLKTKPSGDKFGIPEAFYIQGDKIFLYPIPIAQCIVTIEYISLGLFLCLSSIFPKRNIVGKGFHRACGRRHPDSSSPTIGEDPDRYA